MSEKGPDGDRRALLMHLAGLGAVFVTLSFSWRFGARLVEWASRWSTHRAVVDLANRILHPSGGVFPSALTGQLVRVASSDTELLGL